MDRPTRWSPLSSGRSGDALAGAATSLTKLDNEAGCRRHPVVVSSTRPILWV